MSRNRAISSDALWSPKPRVGAFIYLVSFLFVFVFLYFFFTVTFYFGQARSKGFATLRNVSKLTFFEKIGHAKFVDFRFYSTI